MAVFKFTFRPESIAFDTDVNLYLPDDISEDIPTLYLLHGMYGNHASWFDRTSVMRYAKKYSVAVVCASAENSFYKNMAYGERYYDYFSKELVEYTRKIFPLSKKREKTYIAGLSMGGYGAFMIALNNPETFCAAASLSGCVDINETLSKGGLGRHAINAWGENPENAAKDTNDDIFHLIKNFPNEKQKPRLFFACGTDDYLIMQSRRLAEHIKDFDFDYKYEEGSGAHTWDFWDEWILPAIEFMTDKK